MICIYLNAGNQMTAATLKFITWKYSSLPSLMQSEKYMTVYYGFYHGIIQPISIQSHFINGNIGFFFVAAITNDFIDGTCSILMHVIRFTIHLNRNVLLYVACDDYKITANI